MENNKSKTHHASKPSRRILANIHTWVLWKEKNYFITNYTTLTKDNFSKSLIVRNQAVTTMTNVMPTTPMLSAGAPLQVVIPITGATYAHYVSPIALNLKSSWI